MSLPSSDSPLQPTPARTVLAVSELTEILRAVLEDSVGRVWVEGEISNFSRPSSGHWYFTLKDATAQVRCAMFRNANFRVRPQPGNGDRVLVRAQATVYPAKGDLQLICEHLEPAGEGALLRAFEELKKRLAAEGLFDAALKRPLPECAHRIGLITSATGAAVQDVLAALSRRFPLQQVLLWPVPVQGASAAPAVVEALRGIVARGRPDVVLVVRGGGSLEDLWAFNDERVARAIRACAVPVVTGIGHEIDFTIADFAADLRAPTPTAAAELVSPDGAALRADTDARTLALSRAMSRSLQTGWERLQRQMARLAAQHPQRALQARAQRVDEAEQRLIRAMGQRLTVCGSRLGSAQKSLARSDPRMALVRERERVALLDARLHRSTGRGLETAGLRLRHASAVLSSVNPTAVLERGYAIARRGERVLRDPSEIAAGEAFEVLLAGGSIEALKKA